MFCCLRVARKIQANFEIVCQHKAGIIGVGSVNLLEAPDESRSALGNELSKVFFSKFFTVDLSPN